MKKTILIMLLVCSSAFALKEYHSLSKSIRALGMGGAFYGLSDDEYALFYNPAGLSFYDGGAQLMLLSVSTHISPSITDAVDKIMERAGNSNDVGINEYINDLQEFQGKALYGGVGLFPYFMKRKFAVGLMLFDVKTDVSILGRDLDTSFDITAISDSGLFVGFGTKVSPDSFELGKIFIGATVKGLFRLGGRKEFSLVDIAQADAFSTDIQTWGGGGVGVDGDIGATWELPFRPLDTTNRASLVINNIMATDFSLYTIENSAPPRLTRTLTLAGNTRFPGVWWFDHFDAVLDFGEFKLGTGEEDANKGARTGGFFKHVNWGVEAPMNGWFILRGGFHQGYWTVGLGLKSKIARIDLATYETELLSTPGKMGSRRYAMRLVLGIGTAPPAVRPQIKEEVPQLPKEGETELKKELPEKTLPETKLPEGAGGGALAPDVIPPQEAPQTKPEPPADGKDSPLAPQGG